MIVCDLHNRLNILKEVEFDSGSISFCLVRLIILLSSHRENLWGFVQ